MAPTRSGSAIVVAHGRSSRQTSQRTLAGLYPVDGDSRVARRVEFQRLMQGIALRLAPYATTAQQQQTLADVRKGRYQFAALSTMLDVAAQSHEPFMVEDAVRSEVVRRMPVTVGPLPCEALERATEEAADVNVAVVRLYRDRTPQAAEHLERELREAASAHDAAADALAATPPQQQENAK